MQLIDLAMHIPNFVPDDVCERIINHYESKPNDHKFIEGYYNQDANDIVNISGLCYTVHDDESIFDCIHEQTKNAIVSWVEYINNFGCFEPKTLFNQCSTSHAYRIIKYSDGAYIANHTDAGSLNILAKTTRASCTLNLSSTNDYDGGEFEFFRGKNRVKLGRGDLLIFPSDAFWVHSTRPVTNGARYTVNSFLHPDISMYKDS